MAFRFDFSILRRLDNFLTSDGCWTQKNPGVSQMSFPSRMVEGSQNEWKVVPVSSPPKKLEVKKSDEVVTMVMVDRLEWCNFNFLE